VRAAFESIQLAPILRDITRHGRAAIDDLYPDPYQGEGGPPAEMPATSAEFRWEGLGGVLRRVDVPALIEVATTAGVVIELTAIPGDTLREGGVYARVHGGSEKVSGSSLAASLDVGLERTFEQDPRFAFRLLGDIALRALSPAINDPATAVQAADSIDVLLSTLCGRRLDTGAVGAPDGTLALVLPVPSWDDFVDSAVADTVRAGASFTIVAARLARLLDEVSAAAPTSRREAVDRWRREITLLTDDGAGRPPCGSSPSAETPPSPRS
jgi:uncharacterized membrane protein